MPDRQLSLVADPEPTMEKGADLSACGRYRYRLWRKWSHDAPMVLFVMLNPSTADADEDDPTIRRCIGFAKRWGAGGVRVCNLYAWRSTDPKGLLEAGTEAVGEHTGILNSNDYAILASACDAGRIIAAWGANVGPFPMRRARVMDLLVRFGPVEALKLTKDGQPGHPLYVRSDTEPIVYREARHAA